MKELPIVIVTKIVLHYYIKQPDYHPQQISRTD